MYLEVLVQFIQAALRSHFLCGALWSGHVVVEHAGPDDGTSVSGFTPGEVHARSTPQLQHSHTVRYKETRARIDGMNRARGERAATRGAADKYIQTLN